MKLLRVVLSDLHLVTGVRKGELNPLEDFFHDERFAELLAHYDARAGEDGEVEIILNGDIFDLLKVKIAGVWPTEVTEEVATEKLRQCLEGHPRFVHALRELLAKPGRRVVYLPGNHDLEMWFPGPQELFRRYVAPGEAADKVRFVTTSDTYYLPEGIQIRHGHQFERIHRVDYRAMTRTRRDGETILDLPWGSLWILEVMNPMKEVRSHIDRIQPLGRFMTASLLFDTGFVFKFLYLSAIYFLRHKIFTIRAWRERLASIPRLVKEEIFTLTGGYDEQAVRALRKTRGVHTLIVGHSHGPRFMRIDDHKVLVNTGTWVKMINLDLRYLGTGQRPDLRAHRVQRRGRAADQPHALARRAGPMRSHPLRGLILLGVLLSGGGAAGQSPPPPPLELVAPAELRTGDRTGITALVRLPGDEPFLLTPHSEGTAVEVVRGRLMRGDADDPRAHPLRLRIPIVARHAGDSLVRVRLTGFACAERCEPVRAEAELRLQVSAARRD